MTTPTKENTLNLTVKQKTLDNIIVGNVKVIQREIKTETFELYLDHEGEDVAFNPDLIAYEPDDLLVYNNGVYPFYPIEYQLLHIADIDNPQKYVLAEVKEITFEVMKNKNGVELRFDYDEEEGIVPNKLGDSAYWQVCYHFKLK